ncbi:MAG: hypothetical protein QXP31_03490 [Pyrobaculum sp.]
MAGGGRFILSVKTGITIDSITSLAIYNAQGTALCTFNTVQRGNTPPAQWPTGTTIYVVTPAGAQGAIANPGDTIQIYGTCTGGAGSLSRGLRYQVQLVYTSGGQTRTQTFDWMT